MKTKNLLFTVFFSIFILFPLIASVGKREENEKVGMSRQGGTTRSTSTTIIDAYANSDEVAVDVTNYTGNVRIEVISGRGRMQKTFTVVENGSETVSISLLRSGTYTLRVTLEEGVVYEGIFTKKVYGR